MRFGIDETRTADCGWRMHRCRCGYKVCVARGWLVWPVSSPCCAVDCGIELQFRRWLKVEAGRKNECLLPSINTVTVVAMFIFHISQLRKARQGRFASQPWRQRSGTSELWKLTSLSQQKIIHRAFSKLRNRDKPTSFHLDSTYFTPSILSHTTPLSYTTHHNHAPPTSP